MEKTLKQLLFREKPIEVFMIINTNTIASHIGRKIDCTYSHVVKILNSLQDAGLIKREAVGRLNKIIYTKKGQEYYDKFKLLMDI